MKADILLFIGLALIAAIVFISLFTSCASVHGPEVAPVPTMVVLPQPAPFVPTPTFYIIDP